MGLLDKHNIDDSVDLDFDNTNVNTNEVIESDLDDFSFQDEVVDDTESKSSITLTKDTSNTYTEVDEYIDNESITEDIKDTVEESTDTPVDTRKKPGIFSKLRKKDNEGTIVEKPVGPAKDLVLYMIMDKINATTLEYFRAYGIKVSKIFTNIKEAQDIILMQIEPFKLVIVDTGTGRFSSMGSRKELVDAISLCEDSIDIFYTDTAIKSELDNYEALSHKNIQWKTYKSTADILAHLLSLHESEKYVYDEDDIDTVSSLSEDILNFSGLASKAKLDRNIMESSIDVMDIKYHIENGDEADMLESYIIKV